MATTRDLLRSASANMAESTGVRSRPNVALPVPVAQARDAGRRLVRNVGRIAIDRVIPDPDQPRQEFTEDALNRLATSIRSRGQFSPIRVRWSETHERWVIVFGERRWRAAQRAGLTEIDCVFTDGELTATEILEQQLIENCLREDLQPLEEARAFARLIEVNGWTGKQLAAALQVPPSRITRTLALLKLPADIQQQVAAGEIPARTAYELSRVGSEASVRRLAQQAATGRLTTEAAADAVRRRQRKHRPASRILRQTFVTGSGWQITATAQGTGTHNYHDLEQALQETLDEVRHRIANGIRLF
ncbi:ParB/RepB/Spo0J family partition protein [bacterium]|nr:ParB/RepB/Spo0J family partition protein [bacterium]